MPPIFCAPVGTTGIARGGGAVVVASAAGAGRSDGRKIESLTPRELEILQLVAEGHSNAVIGRKLWLAEQTVKFHLSNVYRKIGVRNRTAAARWAELHGVSSLEATETRSPQNSVA